VPTPLSWQLEEDEASPVAPTGGATTPAPAVAPAGTLSFLGFGLLRPFRRDEKNDFANAGGRALLRARIGQILGTKADSTAGPGELPWRPEFGSRLHLLRHQNDSEVFLAFAETMILEALSRWEPSVRVTRVARVETSSSPKKVYLRVNYVLVDRSGANVVEPDAVDVPL
jgi:phage baseplate assembly protein W